ncbi:MAG: PTH1 family peptidyl-tRNA hydrolase [bacterium]|jgi:PTH1 family peptidyl-tRNA hydrolase
MKLIVGLGNPGNDYEGTLHNVGFSALDELAGTLNVSHWGKQFKGLMAQGLYQGHKFILLKPQTYMNLSGESVQACAKFYKIDVQDIIVASDDLDLPPGKLRYRETGGHGGHNGLRNIIQHFGNQFARLRIGIGRPAKGGDVSNYVLGKPSKGNQNDIATSIEDTVNYLLQFIQDEAIQIQQQ